LAGWLEKLDIRLSQPQLGSSWSCSSAWQIKEYKIMGDHLFLIHYVSDLRNICKIRIKKAKNKLGLICAKLRPALTAYYAPLFLVS